MDRTQVARHTEETWVGLPNPAHVGAVSVEEALHDRRSQRDYTGQSVTLADVGQLLWAVQGVTHPMGYRSAPSAGALYPLETSLVAGAVESLDPGVYRYDPGGHRLRRLAHGDRRAELAAAALFQGWIRHAAAVIVLAGVFERTTSKYGQRGVRYVHIEVGHAAENVYLQALSLGLGTTMVGAFDDDRISDVAALERHEKPLGLLPIGQL